MFSTTISRVSAGVLALGGMALLFASDVLLPRLVPGFPSGGVWLGQLLGAAWLALATTNWLNRSALLGGIYGRPVVLANLAQYFIAAMVLLKIVTRGGAPATVWLLAAPAMLFACAYGWLLLRGPIGKDFDTHRGAQRPSS